MGKGIHTFMFALSQVCMHACTHTHTHTHTHTPSHPRITRGHNQRQITPSLGTWIPELHSRSYTYSWLLPSPPPSAGPRAEQKPSVPSSPSPLTLPSPPTPPRPASIPFVLLQLSLSGSPGRVAGTLHPGCQACRQQDKQEWSVQEQQCRVPRRGHGQVSARYNWGLRWQRCPG